MSKRPAATLSCHCQKVQLAFPSHPVSFLECCCCDCRRAVDWCAEQLQKRRPQQESAKVTPSTTPRCLAVPLLYFPNRLRVVQGASHLQLYMLRPGYNTRRWVATCCWTPLVGDHPAYQRRRLVSYVQGDTSKDHCHPLSQVALWAADGTVLHLPPPARRIFTDDLTAQELESLDPLPKNSDIREPPTSQPRNEATNSALRLPPATVAKTIVTDASLQSLDQEFPDYASLQLLVQDFPLQYMLRDDEAECLSSPTTTCKLPHWNRLNPRLPSHEGQRGEETG